MSRRLELRKIPQILQFEVSQGFRIQSTRKLGFNPVNPTHQLKDQIMAADSPWLVVDGFFRERWGEPAEAFQFDASKVKPGRIPQLESLHILQWNPDEKSATARFATVGMSSRPMLGVTYRTELCYRKRGDVSPDELPQIVRFLANLAIHPFVHQTCFDWGHALKLQTPPPGFPGCEGILFHSALPGDAADVLPTANGPVRILNLIPITLEEILLQRTKGTPALVAHFDRNRVDFLSPRLNHNP